jgi:hypothetical protein
VDISSVSIPLLLILLLIAAAMGALIGGVLHFCYHRRRTAPPHVAETERDSEFSLLERNLPYQRQATPNLHTRPPPPYTELDQNPEFPEFVPRHKTLPY